MDLLDVRDPVLGPLDDRVHRAELARRVLVLVDQFPLRPAALGDDQRLEDRPASRRSGPLPTARTIYANVLVNHSCQVPPGKRMRSSVAAALAGRARGRPVTASAPAAAAWVRNRRGFVDVGRWRVTSQVPPVVVGAGAAPHRGDTARPSIGCQGASVPVLSVESGRPLLNTGRADGSGGGPELLVTKSNRHLARPLRYLAHRFGPRRTGGART